MTNHLVNDLALLTTQVELASRKENVLATAQWLREKGLSGLADQYVQEFSVRIEQAKDGRQE
jgi:hypothetical protein